MRLPLTKRTIALGIALILAAVATVALFSYVQGVEDRALADIEAVETFVAKDTIPAGTPGETAIASGLIEREEIPRKLVSSSAVRSLAELRGTVASVAILEGEQIVTDRWVLPQAARGLIEIPSDRVAMSVQVGIPPGVAGFLETGDHIAILAHVAVPDEDDDPSTPEDEAESEGARTRFLLDDVEVLAVGKRTVVQTDEGAETSEVQRTEQVLTTLAVTPSQAEQLGHVLFTGDVYFTLLPEEPEEGEDVPTPDFDTDGRTAENLFEE